MSERASWQREGSKLLNKNKQGQGKARGRWSRKAGQIVPLFLNVQALIAVIIFLTTLTLYIITLAPSVVALFDDSLEFQLVTYQLGIAHPTGYPLYTLLGKLFTFLPVGDVAYRINLMSGVFGAATVAVLYLLIRQIVNLPSTTLTWFSHLGAITGALMLALNPTFWKEATVAEVYTLNAFFISLLLMIALNPFQAPRQKIWGLALVTGLSLTHHRTAALLVPALALYLLLTLKTGFFDKRTLPLALLVGLLPLLLYLYLPLRGHIGSLDGSYQNTWTGFWRHVGGGGYSTFLFDNPFGHQRNMAFYWDLFKRQSPLMPVGLAGLVWLAWSRRITTLVLTGLAFMTYLGFCLVYQVSDIDVFFIPVFLIWAVWSGVGLSGLLHWIEQITPQGLKLTGAVLLVAGLAYGGLYYPFQLHRPGVTESYTWDVHDYGLDILQQPFDEDKPVIIGLLGEITLLRYFQKTENRQPGLPTVVADLEADRLAAVEMALAEGKTVYLTRELPGAAARWSLNAVGPLIQVRTVPLKNNLEADFPRNQTVTPNITLVGYNLSHPPHTGTGPPPLRLTLFWQATGKIAVDLKVSARLLNSNQAPVAVVDAVPVHFAYPTTAWRAGEIVADVYDLRVASDLPAGQYTPLLIWYDPAQNATEIGRIELETVMIE